MDDSNRNDRQCSRCEKIFKYPSQLVRHLNGLHQCKKKAVDIICNYCGKHYSAKSSLKFHIKTCKEKSNTTNNSTINNVEQTTNIADIVSNTNESLLDFVMAQLLNYSNKKGNTSISNVLEQFHKEYTTYIKNINDKSSITVSNNNRHILK